MMKCLIAMASLIIAASVVPAAAADLLETPCVEEQPIPMIVIYDFEPGVVTRHWWSRLCEQQYFPTSSKRQKTGRFSYFGSASRATASSRP